MLAKKWCVKIVHSKFIELANKTSLPYHNHILIIWFIAKRIQVHWRRMGRRCNLSSAWVKSLIVLMCCICWSLIDFQQVYAQEGSFTPKRVLLLNSYHKGYLWSDEITRGIEETFSGYPVELHIEYMDTKRQFGNLYQTYLSRLLSLKHLKHDYDAVITSDDNAFDYYIENKNILTGDTSPHIFCGVNYLEPARIKRISNVTGVNEKADIVANIELIRRFHPNTDKILIITDNTTTGKSVQKEVIGLMQRDWGALTIDMVYDLSLEDLGKRLKGVGPNTVVLYTFFFRDNTHRFIEYDMSVRFVKENTTAPVYCSWSFAFGSGAVGGYMVDAFGQGVAAAQQALQLFEGESIENIPVKWMTPIVLRLDYRELKRLGLSLENVPGDAEILFRPTSFYSKYKILIRNLALGLVLLIIAFIVALLGLVKAKRSENKMFRSRENLRTTLHSIGDAVIATDSKGHVTQMNPVAQKIIGCSVEDVLGHPLDSVFTIVNSETREPIESPVKKVLEQGHEVGLEDHCVLISLKGKEYQIADSASPIRSKEGNLEGVVLVFRDVTDEYALYKSLQKSETLHRNLFEKANDAIFILEKSSGKCLDANQAAQQITGRTLEELKEMTIQDLSFESANKWLSFEKQGEQTIDLGQVEYSSLDNTRKVAQVSSVLIDENTVVGIARDITHDLEMEHQLRQSQKMEAIGTLAGGIAHDFNNILSGIFSFAQLAQMNLDEPEKAEKNIIRITDGAKRATDLVQQILTFSRHTELKVSHVYLYLIVKEAIKFLRSSIPTSIDIKPNIVSKAGVMADPTQVYQVIMNLCTNSYHAMRETGGSIKVCLEDTVLESGHMTPGAENCPAGPYVMLTITDTGHGMDEQTLARIFDPYFTTKKKGKGTGLGLSVVDGIIKKHNGFITVSSQVNHGTKFRVFWPVADMEHKKDEPKHETEESMDGSGHILVVDDEKGILKAVKALLERRGYTVTTMEDPISALSNFEDDPYRFDLVITDMTMPKMTGAQLVKKIFRFRKNVPVILCTGYYETLSESAVTEMGIGKFLQKPVMPKDLYKAVWDMLNP